MTYTLLRKDYNPGGICHKCHKPLTSPTTIIALDENGDRCYLGKICAESAINHGEDIPNLTKSFTKSNKRNNSKPKSKEQQSEDDLSLALSYLYLRQVSLKDFENPSIPFKKFADLLSKYEIGGLTEGDVRYVLNNMRMNQRSRPFLGITNLKNLYLLDFGLTKALKKINEDKSDFLRSIQSEHLRKKSYLTPKQIKAVSKWFENIDDLKKEDIEVIELVDDGKS